MSSLRTVLLALSLVVALVGCGKDEPAPPAPAPGKVAASAQAVKPAVAPPVRPEPAQPSLPPFVYDATGLRDPFEPFIKVEEKKSAAPRVLVPSTPLQQYAIEQFRLVGVIWGADGKAKALIEDPKGKGYALGAGTLIGDRGGRVVRILPDRIVIEERFTDLFGEEKKNVANIMLHKSEGEVGP